MPKAEHRNFDSSDEKKTFPYGNSETIKIGGGNIIRLTFQPGFKWSKDIGPMIGEELCPASHFYYQEQGIFELQMPDGNIVECNAGDVVSVPPGHDGWVVGGEPVVFIDWYGVSNMRE